MYKSFFKRFLDIFFSLLGIIITSPILLIVAILIKIDSKGPVIFKQQRIGKNGKVFNIYKFRSMVVGAEQTGSGVYSGKGDKGNNDLLLKNLENITDINKRSARFVCCIVVYFPDGKILTANGETEGYITFAPEGEHGFGYDPIFYSLDLNKTLGIASDEEKNTISHRFRAVSKVRDLLKEKDI